MRMGKEPERVYIMGPMRGRAYYNFPAFDAARDRMRALGHAVLNPADMDRQIGFDATKLPADTDWTAVPAGFDLSACVHRDVDTVQIATAYVALEGWQTSVGARAEKSLADWMRLKRLDPNTGVVIAADAESGETRVTDPDTGAQKGKKLARFDLLPTEALWKVAEHYGRGSEKYSPRNWERGYDWSLSFAALMRHAWLFWCGEDNDAETGSPHMAAVVFHALALMTFGRTHPEKDDRPISQQKGA